MLSLKWTDEIKKSENFEGSIIMPQKGRLPVEEKV